MRPSTFWPSLIRELCREHPISFRALAKETGIHRSTLQRFLCGSHVLSTDRLEIILAYFGYELDAFPRKKEAG